MTQADRVLSTPPTNMPIDTMRRHLLTIAAAGTVAAATPTAALAAPPVAATAPAVATAPVLDTALTEIVAKFGRLLDEYYSLRRSDWGPRLAQAHSETDKLFGELLDGGYDKEARHKFFFRSHRPPRR